MTSSGFLASSSSLGSTGADSATFSAATSFNLAIFSWVASVPVSVSSALRFTASFSSSAGAASPLAAGVSSAGLASPLVSSSAGLASPLVASSAGLSSPLVASSAGLASPLVASSAGLASPLVASSAAGTS